MPKKRSIFALLKSYKPFVGALFIFTVLSSLGNLVLPKLIASGIDAYTDGTFNATSMMWKFGLVSVLIFVATYVQNLFQTYTSERVARDLRQTVADKISRTSYRSVEGFTSSKLLTNLTADADAVKLFVSQAIVSIISSVLIIVGASALLISIDWKLGLAVIAILPAIGVLFFFVMSKVGPYFKKGQEVLDRLNKVINESILGAALIRVLNSESAEEQKFKVVNAEARDIGLSILRLFAALIPMIGFIASLASVIILSLGGRFVIGGDMTLGDFTAFTSYISILIFPVLILGFMSTIIGRASASYERIGTVLDAPEEASTGTKKALLKGAVEVRDLSLELGGKQILQHISFVLTPGSKTAIIGPTAAGKTRLLYALIGLEKPTAGQILYDNVPVDEYEETSLHKEIGLVFQDSIVFNMTLRENIAFSSSATDESLRRAMETAELVDFVASLPDGLETIVSERGTSLSGGQKQRIMLARALALNPRVLLLDDFTARVDAATEAKILGNIAKNYPDLTLVSITQKVSSAKSYDTTILLMEGELVAMGTHDTLLETSPEYVQIVDSQESTNTYELHS